LKFSVQIIDFKDRIKTIFSYCKKIKSNGKGVLLNLQYDYIFQVIE